MGLEYFSFDVDIFDDEKVIPISSEFGAKGECIVVRVLLLIPKVLNSESNSQLMSGSSVRYTAMVILQSVQMPLCSKLRSKLIFLILLYQKL